MKIMSGTVLLSAAAGTMVGSLCLWAQRGDPVVPFPDGYRRWAHVKSTVVGPGSAAFAGERGIHHFYANEKALNGYRSGAFPDGSVLVDDLLETKESAGITTEGPRRRLAVMVKDRQRFGEAGGWGFEVFKGDGREATLGTETKAACFACHKNGRDSVFSELRP
jgi:Cytochrome P460